jgi:hypothetical protein
MKSNRTRNFALALIGVCSISSVGFGATQKLNCHSYGGGYITQAVEVNQNDDESLEFKIERFTKVPDIVGKVGLKIDGDLATRMVVTFPKNLCFLKKTEAPHITLLACRTEIAKIVAKIDVLDGPTKEITLGDNNSIEVYRNTRESISTVENTLSVPMVLGLNPEANGLGFWTRECR